MKRKFQIMCSATGGALFAAAAPPYGLWPLAVPALILLKRATSAASVRCAGALGFLFAVIAFATATRWWPAVLEGYFGFETFGAVAVACALWIASAAPIGLWVLISAWMAQKNRSAWLTTSPLLLVLVESWGPLPLHLGTVLATVWPLIQVAEVGSIPAVSAMLVLIAFTIDEALQRRMMREVRLAAALILAVTVAGLARAAHVHASQSKDPISVALLQPGFEGTDRETRQRIGHTLIDELRRQTDAVEDADLVVWPETAFPFWFDRKLSRLYPTEHPWALRRKASSAALVAGALTRDFETGATYNSALVVSPTDALIGTYDKIRLLPFGESFPLDDTELEAQWRARTPDWPVITPGQTPMVFGLETATLGILICSEDLGPDAAQALTEGGATLLVSIVNNAWFTQGIAPSQHAAVSSFRAVENRRDWLRAAMTGPSMLVDALGRKRHQSTTTTRADTLIVQAQQTNVAVAGARTLRAFPFICLVILLLVRRQRKPER